MKLIVGSKALEAFGKERKRPKDVDVWVAEEKHAYKQKGHDYVIMPKEIIEQIPREYQYASPDAVYTIKCSHLQWDIHWQKTKLDILWLENKGCKLIPELYDALVEHWKIKHGNKSFLSLDTDKKDFFNDHVEYKMDHDELHKLVSYPENPMYTRCLKDGKDVMMCHERFKMFSFDWKVRLFREEITVIAIERWLLNDRTINWRQAYLLALKKTITNLTKNWASDFIIQNLRSFYKPDYSYFKYALESLREEKAFMSTKVDLKPFEELLVDLGENENIYLGENIGLSEAIYGMAAGYLFGLESLIKNNPDKYQYKHLEQEGGGEGGAEECHGVFEFNGLIYRASYEYYSHQGHSFDYIEDSLEIVTPHQETITVYR